MAARVFFFVQNLLGIGHVMRAARLARAMSSAGAKVTIASGGVAVEGLDFGPVELVQLPAIKSGPGGFSDLRLADDTPLDDHHREVRRRQLLAAFAASAADVLLIEAYPFGRRGQRFELHPLVKAAQARLPRPLIACSVRDILQSGRSLERRMEMVAMVREFFDLVLVHGDRDLVPFQASFPEADLIADRLVYTGIVADPAQRIRSDDRHDVIIAAGGGVVGAALFDAALAARPLTRLADCRWLIVGGPHLPAEDYQRLSRHCAEGGVDLVRFLSDLPARYAKSQIVVCQAGYNTVADLLVAKCRAVLIPFASAGESEQSVRARLLQERGLAVTLDESALTPHSLAQAIGTAMALPAQDHDIDLQGAQRTAEILLHWSQIRHETAS